MIERSTKGLSIEALYDYYTFFDSDFMDLVDALGLARIGSREYREHLARVVMSQRRPSRLCDRYRDFLSIKERERSRLLCDLARRNAKHSRFSYLPDNFAIQGELDF